MLGLSFYQTRPVAATTIQAIFLGGRQENINNYKKFSQF
jgi:hypothetical protein